ncbi:MAG: hypothetical protein H0V12_05035 [Chloroflexi bacterium]|nr:hypothetical protein [Chloroflexota bacterium]
MLDWLALVVFTLLVAGATARSRKLTSAQGEYVVPALSFFLPSAVARGVHRSFAVLLLFGWFLVITLFVSYLLCPGNTGAHATGGCYAFLAVMVFLVFGALGLVLLIILINRPRRLVPAAMRSQPGALAEWRQGIRHWRRRRIRRHSRRP